MINKDVHFDHYSEQRMEKRTLIDKYYSVQFSLNQKVPIYQFRLKDISSFGLCIVIKKGSPVLEKIHKDEKLDMTFCAADSPTERAQYKTKIVHITPDKSGKYKNHVLMGFAIVDEDQKATEKPRTKR